MLELKDICKRYVTQSFTQVALDNVSLSFRDNGFVAILGPDVASVGRGIGSAPRQSAAPRPGTAPNEWRQITHFEMSGG